MGLRSSISVILLGITCLSADLSAQESRDIATIEYSINQYYGIEKLQALTQLTEFYITINSRKAVKYGKQATVLGERMIENRDIQEIPEIANALVNAYVSLGQAQIARESYFEARRNFELGLELAESIDCSEAADIARSNIEAIDALADDGQIKEGFFSKTFNNLRVGAAISNAALSVNIDKELSQARANEQKGDFAAAIEDYTAAVNLLKNAGDVERIHNLQLKIATLQDSLGRYDEAQTTLAAAIENMVSEGTAPAEKTKVVQADTSQLPQSTLQDSREIDKQDLKAKAEKLAREKNYAKSLEYYKLYQELSQQMYEDSLETEIERERKERELMLLAQQMEIIDLKLQSSNAEKQRQIKLRNNFFFLALAILAACGIILYFYLTKRRQHNQLTKAYADLDRTKTRLETAEKRIVRLLAQQVSGDVANELISNDSDDLAQRRFVCIMFLDIRDFTPMAEKMSPEQLILYQNNVFSDMIDIVQHHHGNINQLLGDGFMATFGAPVSHGNDCQNAFDAAQEILTDVRQKVRDGSIPETRVGIGLHAGYVVTGNVGSEARKQYSITGNAVIVASRVEQLNKEYKTQLIITEDVYNQLEKPIKLNQPFLEVTVKGRTQPVKILKIA